MCMFGSRWKRSRPLVIVSFEASLIGRYWCQVESISRRVDTLKVDGMMSLLKMEVEAVSNLTRCMDAFTNNHTRLVVIVDGLDSCEQDRLLQVLDMVSTLLLSL